MCTAQSLTAAILLSMEPAPGVAESGTVAQNLTWAIIFSLMGGLLGIFLVLLSTLVVPRLVNRLTPDVDEAKEIARGNRAVAEYFGRVTAATILGISLVMAAAILAGILAALH